MLLKTSLVIAILNATTTESTSTFLELSIESSSKDAGYVGHHPEETNGNTVLYAVVVAIIPDKVPVNHAGMQSRNFGCSLSPSFFREETGCPASARTRFDRTSALRAYSNIYSDPVIKIVIRVRPLTYVYVINALDTTDDVREWLQKSERGILANLV